jgi:hypothetical protein
MSSILINDLIQTVQNAAIKLQAFNESDTSVKPAPDKWSKKEILGHLLDSAVNNHHRLVRAQQVQELVFPPYVQDEWVRLQDYNSRPWQDLVELWRLYNLHLAHILTRMPADKLNVLCTIGDREPKKLGSIVDGYVEHLKHHLQQLGIQ